MKPLSERQVSDLRAGRGMGLAPSAELNRYPGPLHVLEYADFLALTPDQRERAKALFEAMKGEAILLAGRLIHEETEMDQLLAAKSVQPARPAAATNASGATRGSFGPHTCATTWL